MDREHEAGHEEVGLQRDAARRDDNGRKNAWKIVPIIGVILAVLLLLTILYASYRWLTSGTTAATQPAAQQPAAQPAPQTVQQGPSQADYDALKAEIADLKRQQPNGSFNFHQNHSGSESFHVEEGRFFRGSYTPGAKEVIFQTRQWGTDCPCPRMPCPVPVPSPIPDKGQVPPME
ncbi:MAG TPA: hypothetical protein VHA78_05630 [Candidatus Peribacteraceae bacterium]|nr:hypothetical protein [Candidatus Peribacteraceae bacterium]